MDENLNNQGPAPAVSVILPVYNGAATLARALASVAAQGFTDYEVIAVDDGSTDGTSDVLRTAAEFDPRIIFVQNEKNLGLQATLNRGLSLARGKYIARLDADDAWSGTDKLAAQVRFLDEHPDYVLVGTGGIFVDESGRELFRVSEPESDRAVRRLLLGRNCFLHGSVLMRLDAARRVGGYDESAEVKHVEDHDLWFRLGQQGKMANLAVFGLRYTVSSGQITSRHRTEQVSGQVRLMKKYKKFYPGHVMAYLRNYLRLFLYGVLKVRPW